MTLEKLEERDPGYLAWMQTQDFSHRPRVVEALDSYNASLQNRRPDFFLVDIIEVSSSP